MDPTSWSEFLKRHDLVFDQMPTSYFDCPFVGNGLLGAMLYKPAGLPVRLDIGSTEVVERRNTPAPSIVDNGRLPIGYFELATTHSFAAGSGRLNIHDAETQFEIKTVEGAPIAINLKVLRNTDVIVLEYIKHPDADCMWLFRPDPSVIMRANPYKHLNPLPESSTVEGVNLCVQKRDAGGCYVTAWKEVQVSDSRYRLLITVKDTYPSNDAPRLAVEQIKKSLNEVDFQSQCNDHKQWWNDFYTRSFLSFPHPQLESMYWGLQYRMASMMRKGAPLCDLMGPYYKPSSWPGIWFNLNTQMLFSSLHISNQPELVSTLPDYIFAKEQEMINAVPEEFRHNSAGLPRCTGKDQMEDVYTWPNAEFPERSNLLYLLYGMWEHYRMTMDDNYLRTQFFPLLKRATNFLLNVVEVDDKGGIHTPNAHSPEASDGKDNNYDIASLRWGCETLIDICKRLRINDSQIDEWKHTLKNLVPYATDHNGFMSSPTISAPLMHRHWCHLFAVYPYYLVNWEQPENRDLILQSIRHWGNPTIPNSWTQAVISSVYSSIRDSQSALKHANLALQSDKISSNLSHTENGWPCSETFGGLNRMVLDMFIQSWGDRIRIFPAIVPEWKEATFADLCAEGGFLVSAIRKEGSTHWLQITSLAGEPCVVEHGFVLPFQTKGAKVQHLSKTTCRLKLKKGERATLYVGDNPAPALTPILTLAENQNPFGKRTKHSPQ